MPGVPSGRGCEACRKQKKKCDQTQPSCSRCIRLGIDCVGVGQRRFKFVKDGTPTRSSSNSRLSWPHQSSATTSGNSSMHLSRTPSNEATTLTASLIEKFHKDFDLRYHLSWTYGDFLEEIPRRLGMNEALDASVAALVSAHSHLSSSSTSKNLAESLSRYNHALKSLRITLDDPKAARQAETLCACYLLLICQPFVDASPHCLSSHTEGAAMILKNRGYFYTNDAFEQRLLMSLRGPVLMESLINDKISFSHEEWLELVENKLEPSTPEGRMMRCWAQMPDLMRRGRSALCGVGSLERMIKEARVQYDILTALVNEFKDRYDKHQLQGLPRVPTIPPEKLCQHYQRIHGLSLAICLVSNCIVQGLDLSNADLEADSQELCGQVLVHAQEAAKYRPLAASYVSLCLIAAWCSTVDVSMKAALEALILDYLKDWPRKVAPTTFRDSLERTAQRLRLEGVPQVQAF